MPVDWGHRRCPTLYDHGKPLPDRRHRSQGMNSKKFTAHINKSERLDRSAWVKPQTLTQVARSARRCLYSRLEKLLQGRLINCRKECGEYFKGSRVDVDFSTAAGKDRDHLIQASTDSRREAHDPPEITQSE